MVAGHGSSRGRSPSLRSQGNRRRRRRGFCSPARVYAQIDLYTAHPPGLQTAAPVAPPQLPESPVGGAPPQYKRKGTKALPRGPVGPSESPKGMPPPAVAAAGGRSVVCVARQTGPPIALGAPHRAGSSAPYVPPSPSPPRSGGTPAGHGTR